MVFPPRLVSEPHRQGPRPCFQGRGIHSQWRTRPLPHQPHMCHSPALPAMPHARTCSIITPHPDRIPKPLTPWPNSIPGLCPLEHLRFSRELRSRHLFREGQQAVCPQPAIRPTFTRPSTRPSTRPRDHFPVHGSTLHGSTTGIVRTSATRTDIQLHRRSPSPWRTALNHSPPLLGLLAPRPVAVGRWLPADCAPPALSTRSQPAARRRPSAASTASASR